MTDSIKQYQNLHLWILAILILMQISLSVDYWGKFSRVIWPIHIHFWSVCLWYIYLILQPYWATHGQLEKHRTQGIIGMFIAGGVAITALALIYRGIQIVQLLAGAPERFAPITPEFVYGILTAEVIMMFAFTYAVYKGIVLRKQLHEHAWWLACSGFIMMFPGFSRGFFYLWFELHADVMPNVSAAAPVYIAVILIICLLLVFAYQYKRLTHPATYLTIAVNLIATQTMMIGSIATWQSFLQALIKV